ncbi:MAG: hypothetical protein C0501_22275 [Isosphaera sp.]|nr:hypothetical protein [Isosphaera sp.]
MFTGEGSPPCPKCGAPPGTPGAAPSPARGGGPKLLGCLLLGGLGLLAVAVVLAETGAVTAEKTESKWSAEGQNKARYETAGRGRPAPLRGVQFTPAVTVGVPRGTGHDLATAAADAIRKAGTGGGPGQSRLEITITRVAPDGSDWVPFFKSGSCSFTASYTLAAETPWSSFAGEGQVTGTVTQSMNGFCSTGLFREKMGQAIAAAILGDISKLVAKYS